MIEEIAMKKLIIVLLFLIFVVGCAVKGGKPFSELGKPDVFCSVIQEPDPLLMGTWECKFYRLPPGAFDATKRTINYVKYRLIQYEDKYALYFYRAWRTGQKRVEEWKNWTIDGKEISGDYGVRIFVQGGGVYFTIRGADKPARMSRIEG
jgi:hypothetical protein